MLPEIRVYNGKKVLYVGDAPFYAVAGEVHNSDASSSEYMEEIWRIADDLGLNTLLLPVTWELLEPVEGTFDFSVPDELIHQARKWKKKIIFLWFGSWKNAEMMYAPSWVKKDRKRFKRAQIIKGEEKSVRDMGGLKIPYYSLSYLCEETREADANAFANLMAHIRQTDEDGSTVIAVQVENETGVLGSAREVSDMADMFFGQKVPDDFVKYMKMHAEAMEDDIRTAVEEGKADGTWSEVFGDAAEEIFSAFHIASFVNYVAERGKGQHPLPMLANCWLAHRGDKPGDYPSGGPVSRVHEVWRYCAPALDVLCPDIYVPEFFEVCDEYTRKDTPLFIPEAATHSYAASRLAYCIGHYHAMCYSPFGFDDIGKPFSMVQGMLFGVDVGDPALKTPQKFEDYARVGKALTSMMPMIAPKYGTTDLQAVCAEQKETQSMMDFGNIRIMAVFQNPLIDIPQNGFALGVKMNTDEIYLVGYNCVPIFMAGDAKNLDILELEEGEFVNGKWNRRRKLNGDEAALMMISEPSIYRVKIHTYNDGM